MITLADFDTFPDFPVPGVLFYDIAPILASPERFRDACDALTPPPGEGVDLIAGVDARGFIFAPVIAQDLGIGMTMVRKKGKLPGELLEANATIEYGSSELTLNPQGVDHVRLAGAVRPHHARDPWLKLERGRRREGLESPERQRFQMHGASLVKGARRSLTARETRCRSRGWRTRHCPIRGPGSAAPWWATGGQGLP